MTSALAQWIRFQLSDRIDAASFAVVRISMGILLVYDAYKKGPRYFATNADRDFTFRYEYFYWLPEEVAWSYPLHLCWLVLSGFILIGFCYRLSCVLVTLLVTYGFLLREEFYLNHYYLLILVLMTMCVIPMHKTWSVDAWMFRSRSHQGTMRRGYLTLMKAQIEIVLIYAGLVKLNWDWLRLEPIRTWLMQRTDDVWYGAMWNTDIGLLLGSFGPVALHLFGAPLLLWKRTRLAVFVIYLVFHVTNHFIFHIGIFPWMTIALTTLFFDPDWPRRALNWLGLHGAAAFQAAHARVYRSPIPVGALAWVFVAFAFTWTSAQILLPLRHFLIAGEARWTDEGHRFAWRMKLLDREAPTPMMLVYLPERGELRVPLETNRLTSRQKRKYKTSSGMIRQYAKQLAGTYRTDANPTEDIRVHVWSMKSVNNRKFHPFIDPKVDLVTSKYKFFGHDDWVISSTPYDIRRAEEVVKDLKNNGQYEHPPLSTILRDAGLPPVAGCAWDEGDEAFVCSVVRQSS